MYVRWVCCVKYFEILRAMRLDYYDHVGNISNKYENIRKTYKIFSSKQITDVCATLYLIIKI